jgi:A/G-specific adenine glycosylase
MNATPYSAKELGDLRTALLSHYDRHRRVLPWRGESDPYRVLVSEVMLQQTRVETVTLRYAGWLDRFPDVETLARAEEDDVLKAWEGLGYYRRARNLHWAARLVRDRPDGSLPGTYAELRALPGVGDYTAGAVASIAFGEAVAAVDGNVRRILARLRNVARPTHAWLRSTASALVDPERPGDWNQALMDLGATVCVPRAPRCEECPVSAWCAARAAGTQRDRPKLERRPKPRVATVALAVLHSRGRVLLERRPSGGLLGGMWAFPEREVATAAAAARVAWEIARERALAVAGDAVALPACKHQFTHLHVTYLPVALQVDEPREMSRSAWIDADRPTDLALPVAQRRVLASWLLSACGESS